MSCLFKRVTLPLLAVIAACTLTASLCAPARAATATLNGYGRSGSTVLEFVHCTIADAGSTWYEADYHAQELSPVVTGASTTDNGIYDTGPGDYNDGANISYQSFGAGSYNLWVVCSGYGPNYSTWNASTGGGTIYNL